MKPILISTAILASLLLLGWIGLKIKPGPFAPVPFTSGPVETMPLPAGLPAPVERYYRRVYGGDQIPVYTSVVFTGRGPMRPFGPFFFQGRFRFTHIIGRGYRHYIEMTFFGLPILKINERYIDGVSLFELPFGSQTGPKLEQAANLGVWAELSNLPAALLNDPRVHWEPVDDETALLFVPFGNDEQNFVARFDPQSGELHSLEAMRYRDANDDHKALWVTQNIETGRLDGQPVNITGAAKWHDMAYSWAAFTTEQLVVNAVPDAYFTAKGP